MQANQQESEMRKTTNNNKKFARMGSRTYKNVTTVMRLQQNPKCRPFGKKVKLSIFVTLRERESLV